MNPLPDQKEAVVVHWSSLKSAMPRAIATVVQTCTENLVDQFDCRPSTVTNVR